MLLFNLSVSVGRRIRFSLLGCFIFWVMIIYVWLLENQGHCPKKKKKREFHFQRWIDFIEFVFSCDICEHVRRCWVNLTSPVWHLIPLRETSVYFQLLKMKLICFMLSANHACGPLIAPMASSIPLPPIEERSANLCWHTASNVFSFLLK